MTITFMPSGSDIFQQPYKDFDLIVNPVNTVGVSGAGLALEFKKQYPDNYIYYWGHCNDNFYSQDRRCLYYARTGGPIIVNAATKDHWRDKSELGYVDKICISLAATVGVGVKVAVPALGCGKGKLAWEEVKEIMLYYFTPRQYADWLLFEPR